MADQVYYEVERLLGKKVENKKLFYLVRWKNYGPEHDTWEPVTNLKSCSTMFTEFAKQQKAAKSTSLAAKLLKNNRELTNKSPKVQPAGAGKKKFKGGDKKALISKLRLKSTKAICLLSKAPSKMVSKGSISKKISKTLPADKALSGRWRKMSTLKIKRLPLPERKKLKSKVSSDLNSAPKLKKHSLSDTKSDSRIISKTKMNKQVSNKKSDNSKQKLKRLDSRYKEKQKLLKVKKPREGLKVNSVHVTGKNKKSILSKKQNSSALLWDTKSNETDTSVLEKRALNKKDNGCDIDDDDDDVLYSLNVPEMPVVTSNSLSNTIKEKNKKVKQTLVDKQNSGKNSSKKNSQSLSPANGLPITISKNKRRMSLLDFKKPKPKQKPAPFEQLLRPSSPTLFFTPLKAMEGSMRGAHVPTSANLNMDSLAGDVPAYPAVPAGPLSPSAMSYKTLLDNLPSQFHPRSNSKSGKKKDSGSSVTGSMNGSGDSAEQGAFEVTEPIERRISVRATECVFRYKQIVVKKCHRYTQIWLNTQTTLKNAFNPQVVQEVVAALNTAKYDDSSLVLFSSIGNFFSSGTDLHFLVTGDRRVAARQMTDALRELTKAFITFPKPVMAAVGGAAVGLGVALLCLCDVVYTSDKASFHLPYAQLSQTPEACSSFTLPSAVGLASANELLFGGRRITAMEAYQLGLVSHVFWPTALMQEVIPRAQHMANCSAKVLEGTKLLIRSHHRTKLELTNETECNLLLERWSSSECQRAIETYLANENNFLQ